jgi:hypothetical protein
MTRSYGTPTLRTRAIGSHYFVGLDFSPVYNVKTQEKEPWARFIFIPILIFPIYPKQQFLFRF